MNRLKFRTIFYALILFSGILVLAACLYLWFSHNDAASQIGTPKEHVHSESCDHEEDEDHGDHDHEGHDDHEEGEDHEGHEGHDDHEEGEDHEDHEGHDDHEEGEDHEGHEGHDDHEEGEDHEDHEGHDDHEEGEDHKDHEGHDDHEEGEDHEGHEGHHHGAKGEKHEAGAEVALSAFAMKNISLDSESGVMTLEPGSFTKTHTIPAMVLEFEGRTTSRVPTPFAGIVTKIYHEPGESVKPGEPLFDVTLSLPAVMDGQLALLKLQETQEFLEREIAEIDTNLNGMAPQRRRELDVRLKETMIELANQRNALRVLGLPEEVIAQVETDRKPIVHVVTVPVPPVSHHGFISEQNPGEMETSVVFETLSVNVGTRVEVGETLCDVCDLCELTVRGDAFAVNEGILLDALRNPQTPVRVTFEGTGKQPIEGLHLRMVESKIDETNRTLSCFADFANVKLNQEEPETESHPHLPHYVHWLYKPGQRCLMEISYETIENVFVVPAGAVARDVHDTFVFELEEELANGEKIWHRHPVHLLLRTKEKAVLANDGSLKPGIRIAARSASFLQDALNAQNGSGTKIDPHAGHNH